MATDQRHFKVKVTAQARGTESFMYWTWSGATVNFDEAAIFTEDTVPPLFRQSLEQPYIEKIYI